MIPPHRFHINEQVLAAMQSGVPVVALESTVIAHGLPWPVNFETVTKMKDEIHRAGAVPATIGIWKGIATVGLSMEQIKSLAQDNSNVAKAGRRDIAWACAMQKTAATTVSSTMYLAALAGIRFFATGGIGGVHRAPAHPWDVSADLFELSKTAVAIVCSGAKSILDIPATLEILESYSVPVLGFQTDEFPAFYLRMSRRPVSCRVDTAKEAGEIAGTHWQMGGAGLIIGNPIPIKHALPEDELNKAMASAAEQALAKHIQGKALTPFLLASLGSLTGGKSTEANIALLVDNARLAAQIAAAYEERIAPT